MPSGPGIIDDDLARKIATSLPPGVESFLLTSRDRAGDIVDHLRHCCTTTVQIVKPIDPAEHERIKDALPDVKRVQVVHVEGEDCLEFSDVYESLVDEFLLDSGRPGARIAELGGTGRVHDWNISKRFVRNSRKPVYLAGGLSPGNVSEAIRKVRPQGVDVCSGVRSEGRLNAERLKQFRTAVGSRAALCG